MITLDEAKKLRHGEILIDEYGKRWKVTGFVQRWKRTPDRIRVPLKHGLYQYGALTDGNFRDGKCEYLTKES